MEESKQVSDSKSDFTTGAIAPKLLRFMLPVLGALILQAMYGAVDVWVVGRFGTTEGLSGVSTGSNVVNLVVFTIAGLAMGVTVMIGKYLGEKRPERAGKVIGCAIAVFAVAAAFFTVVLLVLARPLSRLMQAPESAIDETVLYVRICGGGIVFIIAYNVISSIFRGLGNSRLPLIFVGIACVVNIIGDLVFVAVLHLDVVGAALATVLAQAVSVVLSLVIISRQELPFAFTVKDIGFGEETAGILKVGSPIALQEILTQLSFLALCAFINRLGLDASSGYGVAQKLVSFVMLVPSSLMQSMSSFIAQNVGAGLEKRTRKAMLTGMLFGAVAGIIMGYLAYFEGDTLAGFFSKDPAVIARAAEYLKGFAPEAVLTSVLFSFIGYFSGHGLTLWTMAQGLAQSFIVRLPMSFLMSIQPNASLTQIGWAAPTATVFGILINVVAFLIYTSKLKKSGRLR